MASGGMLAGLFNEFRIHFSAFVVPSLYCISLFYSREDTPYIQLVSSTSSQLLALLLG
jgi:hypothetical protein